MGLLLAGGSALAKKLINIYFTLFQLILEGKVGRTADKLEAEKEKEKKPKKNGQAHKKKHSKRQAAQDSKKPHGAKSSPATQVYLLCCAPDCPIPTWHRLKAIARSDLQSTIGAGNHQSLDGGLKFENRNFNF